MDTNQLNRNWSDPASIYRGAPFWSWNGELETGRLCDQIESMKKAGLGGFFMHSRYGLKTEYLSQSWFDRISDCVNKAAQLDMKAYLYDEDRWPSGDAGGNITRNDITHRLRYLAVVDPGVRPENVEKRLGLFRVILNERKQIISYTPVTSADPADKDILAFDMRYQEPRDWENDGAYIDTMNHDAVRAFIDSTHERYAHQFRKHINTTIPAIFTDEPNIGIWVTYYCTEGEWHISWSKKLVEEFQARRGYSLLQYLPELVFPLAEDAFSKPRHDYFLTITELFTEHFSKQIGEWCRNNNIALTGHVLFEGTLESQPRAIGAAMPHYEYMQWPGIDVLFDRTSELNTVKQCSSVAGQLGKERVLSEVYGGTGWDWPLERHKLHGDWQYVTGIDFRCHHLTHYSLAGGAKRDYPASFRHSPWWKYYKLVEDYFGRLSFMLSSAAPIRDILVIHPIASAWGFFSHVNLDDPNTPPNKLNKQLDAISYELTGQHRDWDFADESMLERYGSVKGQELNLSRMSYKVIIVPPIVTLRASTVALLQKFIDSGGTVLFVDSNPSLVDASPSELPHALKKSALSCATDKLVGTLDSILPRRISVQENGTEKKQVWTLLKTFGDNKLMCFLQSHDCKAPCDLSVALADAPLPAILWDPLTGAKTQLQCSKSADAIKFDLTLPPSGSALLTFGLDVPDAAKPSAPAKILSTKQFEGPFDIELSEPNTIPLDYCTYRFGDEPWSEPVPTLKVDQQIRSRFGLRERMGHEQQPWYLIAAGIADATPRGRMQMLYEFHITDMPGTCSLAIEKHADFAITINGNAAGKPSGFWVDEDFELIDISANLVQGKNQVMLDFEYRLDMELEDMYLVGRFGVKTIDGMAPRPGNVTMIKEPRRLALGPWLGQGLDFYTGSVSYKLKIDKPANGRAVIKFPGISCTMAAVHANGNTAIMAWAPFEADLTDMLKDGANDVTIEVIGGRKNTLGPLHVPTPEWTGPWHFDPARDEWQAEYILTPHGLLTPVILDITEKP